MTKSFSFFGWFLFGAQLVTLLGWLAVQIQSLRQYVWAVFGLFTLLWVLCWVLDDAMIRSLKVAPSSYYSALIVAFAVVLIGWGGVLWIIY
jgi:hypothetical protein